MVSGRPFSSDKVQGDTVNPVLVILLAIWTVVMLMVGMLANEIYTTDPIPTSKMPCDIHQVYVWVDYEENIAECKADTDHEGHVMPDET